MMYDQQRAAWKVKATSSEYEYDKMDSSTPAPPPVTHRHHFRLGVFQMRLGMSYLKKIERVKNGGLTDEESKAQAAMRAAEREKRVKDSLMLATGAQKQRTDSAMDEVVVNEVEVLPAEGADLDEISVATEMSYMTKQRLKEQELEEKINPIFIASREIFNNAIVSFSHALELYISSNKPDSGAAGDLTTGVEIYYSRGRCYMLAHEFSNAIKDFNRCLEILPYHVPSLMLRGNSRISLGQYPQARRWVAASREAMKWRKAYLLCIAIQRQCFST